MKPAVGIIGVGQMGGAIARGLLKQQPSPVKKLYLSDKNQECLKPFLEQAEPVTSELLVKEADVVIVAVKPHLVEEVIKEIAPELTGKILVSVAAGVSLKKIAGWGVPAECEVVRVMPNTPALIGQGFIAITPSKVDELLANIFNSLGEVVFLEEKYFDHITALSGSGPAYIYLVAEALIDGAVRLGLPRDVARKAVVQTLIGAGTMLKETQEHPGILRDAVVTPGGTTAAGLYQLEKQGIRGMFADCLEKAYERAKNLT
ncbi:pyrroline-5-carboxylate reductase [Carboxydothermus islandicus]|uniref:Pyrroline-5-carboxylate reductase n=1 Tax=Carboxydothermus islandicus TaxID=661089 RepID=A0A1L8D3H1_9THEO|nr:pyrroline-5-carboxylate reductase [Carboxydothermus islandicus]GAV25722.1 pyrroline-5-carboxylate reductase [Carboxydothermus islandicus]